MTPSLSYSFTPKYLSGTSSWVPHLPFAYELMKVLEPAVFVELGTWNGDSFFTFCQAVQENRLSTTCYAVDHWKGDEMAGEADSSQFHRVQSYCSENYRAFAYLMRTDFASAAREFSDGQIGLLHIDGLHTYEAVSADFATWFPKVREGGVILLHDICVRSSESYVDFGVWKFWNELQAQHKTFDFNHGCGLGVVVKGENPNVSAWLTEAFDGHKAYYVARGMDLQRVADGGRAAADGARLAAQNATLTGQVSHLQGSLVALGEKLAATENRLHQAMNAIEKWNRRSWVKRALHKVRLPH
jgi:hypothetical protein